MIEHVIASRLLADAQVKAYCNDRVFAVFAPDGTKCPYIVIEESDAIESDDVIATFEVMISVYDFNTNKRPLLKVGKRIKDLLHWETFEDSDGNYSVIRVWFEDRAHIKDADTTLSHLFIRFSARACENVN
jgi:hypothetical protein